MDTATLLGFIAATLTSLSFVPQAVMVIRTKRTAGISLLMYTMFVTGVGAWLVYGFMTNALPLIVANTVTFVLSGTVLVIAARERWGRRGTLLARAPGVPLTPEQNPDMAVVGDD